MENIIEQIVGSYGTQIWTWIVVFIVTALIIMSFKSFVENLIHYITIRMGSIGYKSYMFYNKEIYIVDRVGFKAIKLINDHRIVFIPLRNWISMNKEVPQPKLRDFQEWDGKDRRMNSNIKNGFGPEA